MNLPTLTYKCLFLRLGYFAKRRLIFEDLPTVLGGTCTSFLLVEEQCAMLHVSKRFRSFALYGMRMPRANLIITRKIPDTYAGDAIWNEFQAKTTEKFEKLAAVCHKPQSVLCRVIRSDGTTQLQPLYATSPASRARASNVCVSISALATYPCGRHIQDLDVVLLDTTAADIERKYFSAFESLQIVRLYASLRPLPPSEGWTHDMFTKVKDMFHHVPRVELKAHARSNHLDATSLSALSDWRNLNDVDLQLDICATSRFVPTMGREKREVGELIQNLADHVTTLKLKVVYTRLRGFEENTFFAYGDDVRELIEHTTATLQGKYPEQSVSYELDQENFSVIGNGGSTMTWTNVNGFTVWMTQQDASNALAMMAETTNFS